jgi:hypothetical protein
MQFFCGSYSLSLFGPTGWARPLGEHLLHELKPLHRKFDLGEEHAIEKTEYCQNKSSNKNGNVSYSAVFAPAYVNISGSHCNVATPSCPVNILFGPLQRLRSVPKYVIRRP